MSKDEENKEVENLLRIKPCPICSYKGTVIKWPSGFLQCDNKECNAIGDSFTGIMQPNDYNPDK